MFQEKSQKRGLGEKIGIAAIILLVILIICTFVVYGLFKGVDAAPSVFGYRIYIMNNDTMGEQIKKGSAVFIKEGLMPANEGNVILVTCPDTESDQNIQNGGENSQSVKNKLAIVAYCGTQDVTMPDGTIQAKHIVKYGNAPDSQRWVVNTEDIIGKAESYDPVMGAVIRFVSSKTGVLVMVIIPCSLIVIYEIVLLILSMRKKLKESDKDGDNNYGYPSDSKDNGFDDTALRFGSHNARRADKESAIKPESNIAEDIKAEKYPGRTIAFSFDRSADNNKPEMNLLDNSAAIRKAPNNADDIPQFKENYSLRTQAVNIETMRSKPEAIVSPAPAKASSFSAQPKQEAAAAQSADNRSSSQRIDELMRMLKEETEKLSGNK